MSSTQSSDSNENVEYIDENQISYEEESESSSSDQSLDPDNTSDIRNISIKQIDKDGYFGLGKYGEFEVYLMMKSDKLKGYVSGYINATKLCSLAEKKFPNWLENSKSKSMIKAFAVASGIPEATMVVKITTSAKSIAEIRGTYVHPVLVPHIATWASPEFAIKVSEIVNQYHISQVIEEKNQLLKKKQDKIDRMTVKIDKILKINKKILAKNNEQTEKIGKMDNRIKRLLAKNNDMHSDIQDINGKLLMASHARVVPNDGLDNNMLVIVKNNADPEEYNDHETIYEYNCMRLLRSTYRQSIAKHKSRYPDMEILLSIDYSPNSINLFKRIKERLKNKIEFDRCRFNLCAGYTEDRLINDIKKIHDKRLNTKTL